MPGFITILLFENITYHELTAVGQSKMAAEFHDATAGRFPQLTALMLQHQNLSMPFTGLRKTGRTRS